VILLVDDDPTVLASLEWVLRGARFETRAAATPQLALAAIDAEPLELVIQDMNYSRDTSGAEGLALLDEIRRRRPHLPVILMTAWGSLELAVEGMRRGARDFMTKPWSNERVIEAVQTALSLATLPEPQAASLSRQGLAQRGEIDGLIGDHPAFLKVIDIALRVAPTEASVLITGEPGTGKELIAELLHRSSPRHRQPFVKVNLGGLSTSLFESEMFGYVKGAFTDARSDRRGRFEIAAGGTIFLDEIGDLEAACQVKLLRVLQDRCFEPLGSSTTRKADVRIVSATNRPLPSMVAQGSFREDLYYRLNLIELRLPPLRDRRSDIPLLAEHFLAGIRRVSGRAGLALAPAARNWLEQHDWPGNIRQLRSTIERAALLSQTDALQRSDLDTGAALFDETAPPALPAVGSMTLEQIERAMIEKAMSHHSGNITHVADALGLTRAALYRRLKKYGHVT
jgi:DNA-binding NtrC family response regulator